ncbi:MAG: hypothetical protein KGJ09_09215 [Candidatus Omnitrophica bacterium]|nr:hypothetical protein [Candidatus Omnitrophota bacterium]
MKEDIENPLDSHMHQPGAGLTSREPVLVHPGYEPTNCPQCGMQLVKRPTWFDDQGNAMDEQMVCSICGVLKETFEEIPESVRFPQRDPKNPGKAKTPFWLQSLLQPMPVGKGMGAIGTVGK